MKFQPLVKQLSSQLDSEILMVRGEVDTITKQVSSTIIDEK